MSRDPYSMNMQGGRRSPHKQVPSPHYAKGYSLLEVSGDLKELENFERQVSKYRLPPDVKPCVLRLLSDEGPLQTLENWKLPSIIACELRRVGYTRTQVQKRLERWEKTRPSEISSALRVAFEREYEFGCPTLESLGICLYKTRYDCPWFAQIPRKSGATYRERDFYRYGWPKKLKCSEQCIYFALREIENKRGMPAGTQLFASEREMADTSGLCRKTVRIGLKALRQKGLIEFKSGQRHKHYGIAGEVRRIIPIPKPER